MLAGLKPGMIFFRRGVTLRILLAAGLASGVPGRPGARVRANARALNVAASSSKGAPTLSDFGLAYATFNTVASGKLSGETVAELSPTPLSALATSLDTFVEQQDRVPGFIKIDA